MAGADYDYVEMFVKGLHVVQDLKKDANTTKMIVTTSLDLRARGKFNSQKENDWG